MSVFMRGAVLAQTLLLCSCVSVTDGGAVGIQRKQFMLLPSSQVDAMAAQSYSQTIGDGQKKGVINTDKANLARVRKVADRLIPQVATFRSDALKWQWEVNLETRDELNAYCAPGGKIMFYTGIINRLKLTDDEIAAIMGHEIAHALREHGRERMSQAYAEQVGMQLAGSLLGMDAQKAAVMQTVVTLGLTLPHSRGHESEADVMGVELAARAGYDPRAAISLWQKMASASGGGTPAFLSTHPSSDQRIANLQSQMVKVMPLYEATKARKPVGR